MITTVIEPIVVHTGDYMVQFQLLFFSWEFIYIMKSTKNYLSPQILCSLLSIIFFFSGITESSSFMNALSSQVAAKWQEKRVKKIKGVGVSIVI